MKVFGYTQMSSISSRAPVRCHCWKPRLDQNKTSGQQALNNIIKAGTATLAATLLLAGDSSAFVETVGSFGASGFIFKDTVDVFAVEDPEVAGVTLYVSEMQRSLSDKLSSNFFNDPSQASLACVVTAPPVINNLSAVTSKDGQELFSQGRNLSLFQQKSLRIRRLYDAKRSVVVYVAYSTRLTSANDEGGASTGRYKYASMLDWLSDVSSSLASYLVHA